MSLLISNSERVVLTENRRGGRGMATLKSLEALGRVRLSPSFFMRDFLHSEVAQIEGLLNVPVDPDLAIEAGRNLCKNVLEPIQAEVINMHLEIERYKYRYSCTNIPNIYIFYFCR